MTAIQDLGNSRHIRLTTYRRDGREVATPVWVALNGDELFVVTEAGSGKVKRIRNSGPGTVTACDIRGRVQPGAVSAEGQARLLSDAETEAGRKLIARKYVTSRLGNGLANLFRIRRAPMAGVAITLV